MPTENRLINEIKKILNEHLILGNVIVDKNELSECLYDLIETTANSYYNTMKINKEEEGTTARFNHWAINHFKK